MDNISYKKYDLIAELPVDKEEPTTEQLNLVNTLFKPENKKAINTIFIDMKDALFVGILFIIFSIPQIDSLIGNLIPITLTSPYILILIKALAVMILFWVIKYFYLSKSNNCQ